MFERESGKIKIAHMERLEGMANGLDKLRALFPRLKMELIISPPYTDVTLKVNGVGGEVELVERLEVWPSEKLITQLMLMS